MKLSLAMSLLVLAACSSSTTAPSGGAAGGDGDAGGGGAGHSVSLDVTLNPESAGGSQLAFLSPSNTIIRYPASDIVGKPYLVGAFKAGFSAGNDPPVDHAWGVVPADLKVHYATPASLADGAYDVVFVVYKSTPITAAIQSGPAQSAPAAKGGDLASFTLDTSAVRAGDPKNALGTIRVNVDHADAAVALENRVPADPTNASQTTAAFANTILTIP